MINFQAKLRKTGLRTLPAPSSAHQTTAMEAGEDSKNQPKKSAEPLKGASGPTPYSTVPSVEPAYLDQDLGSETTLLDLPSTPLKREVLQNNVLSFSTNLSLHCPNAALAGFDFPA
jgi:hypothetical protein